MRITDGLLASDRARRPPKSVSADQDTLLRAGAPKNGFVGSCLHAEIAYVDRVVPSRHQRFG